jgi:hypothetical protein
MTTGSSRFIKRVNGMNKDVLMLKNKWFVFVVALFVWAAFFYFIDKSIMQGQGLPVGANLMPV